MKKLLTCAFLLCIKIGTAQIGLLQTNDYIKESRYEVNPSFLFDLKPLRYQPPEQLTSPLTINCMGCGLAKRYFLESTIEKINKLKDSINPLRQSQRTLNKLYTSTEFKMWNYFVLFEDSSKSVKDYNLLVDSIAEEYSNLVLIADNDKAHQTEIDNLDKKISNIHDSLKKWEDHTVVLDSASIMKKDSELHSLRREIRSKIIKTDRVIRKDSLQIVAHQKNYNRIISYFFRQKKTSTKDFGALPQVTKILGERETVPGAQLLGSFKFGSSDNDFIIAEGGLLLGVQENPDKPNLKTLFVDQASTFHLFTQFNYGFGTVGEKDPLKRNFKRLGINLHLSFNTKKILTDTAKSTKIINPSLFHTQAGLELAILPKALSIYANVNTLTIFDKFAEFKAGLNISRKFYGFVDCGAKIFLDPQESLNIKNAKLFINANFIVNSGDIRYITKTEDIVTPNIQVGIKTSF